ncbi:MAG: arginine deiminase-related protein [bacterium]
MLKKVLMCTPNHFQVEYQINPWMKPGTVDTQKALDQWHNLVAAYKASGIEVEILDQKKGLADMVFAADQGLIVSKERKILLLSNFKYTQRQGESLEYKRWFIDQGYRVDTLPKQLTFEGGGECIPWNGKFFIGEGFRNNSDTYKYIEKKYKVEFIPLKLINEKFYHLDTCFFVLNQTTAFYYPPALAEKSITKLEQLFPNLIEFTTQEIEAFAANSVVTENSVFMQTGSQTFKDKVEFLGYTVIQADISEFIKSGGGIHCLTFELDRQPQFQITLKENFTLKITSNPNLN